MNGNKAHRKETALRRLSWYGQVYTYGFTRASMWEVFDCEIIILRIGNLGSRGSIVLPTTRYGAEQGNGEISKPVLAKQEVGTLL